MITQKTVVFCGALLLLFFASVMPASADICSDYRAGVGKLLSEVKVMHAERVRVSHIKPRPRTDVKFCAALAKVMDHSAALVNRSKTVANCFSKQELDEVIKEILWNYNYSAEGLRLYRCD